MNPQSQQSQKLKIRIVGVGNAGVEMLKKICAHGPIDATIVAVDTDLSALSKSGVKHALALGGEITDNMGCGGDPTLAKEAALANLASLRAVVNNADMIVILTALGGGTGSVVAPILSKLAFEGGVKCIANFCILPLQLEGAERVSLADKAFKYLHKRSNIAISMPNDIIMSRTGKSLKEAYDEANECVANAVLAILNMISGRGIINTDFPTLRKIFAAHGANSFFASGQGFGENAAEEAVENLKKCPLLSDNIPSAKNLLINIVCGENMEMNKTRALLELAKQCFNANGRVGYGIEINPDFDSKIEITAIGTEEAPSQLSSEPAIQPEAAPVRRETEQIMSNENSLPQAQNISESIPQGEIQLKPPHKRISTKIPEDNPVPVKNPDEAAVFEPLKPPQPAPRPVTEEEEPQRKRRGFFGFGRKKSEQTQEQPVATQSEFKFVEKSQQRGFFEDTPPNIRNGEDLDVPTFMRRNIKINL